MTTTLLTGATGFLGSHIAEAVRLAGIELAVWTVDDPAEMLRLTDLGVGAIATNVPDVALRALEDGDRKGG